MAEHKVANVQDEFNRYIRMVKESGGVVASRRHIDKKTKEIQDLQAYKLTDVTLFHALAYEGRYHGNDREKEVTFSHSEEPRP